MTDKLYNLNVISNKKTVNKLRIIETKEVSMYYIGVDLGTSALKLVMMDSRGELVKSVSKEYPLYFPYSGWSEQNPTDWFLAVKEGLKELAAGAAEKIAGISFGGQMHGLVILDKDDNVLRPAILE